MRQNPVVTHMLWLTWLPIGLYPLVLLLQAWSGSNFWGSLVMMAGLLSAAWLGTGYVLWLRRLYARHETVMRLLEVGISLGLICLCGVLMPYHSWVLRISYGLLLGSCFLGGTRLVFRPLSDWMHLYSYLAFCLETVAVVILLYLGASPVSRLPLLVVFVWETVVLTLHQNRKAFSALLIDRDGAASAIPEELRKNNRRQMCLFLLLGLALVCGCGLLAAGLRQLGQLILRGLAVILRWLLASDETQSSEDVPSVSPEPAALSDETAPSWLSAALGVGLLVIFLALVIWQRRAIGAWLLYGWESLQRWVRQRLSCRRSSPAQSHGIYCDYVEDLLQTDAMPHAKKSLLSPHIYRWQRTYRHYRRMSPSAEKFRLGYRLLLEKLPEGLVCASDSPNLILQKWEAHRGTADAAMTAVTQTYMDVRYGDISPEENAFVPLEQLLRLKI